MIKLFSTVTIRNDVGGTTRLPEGRYRVEIDREWDDYETGGHASGLLIDEADIEVARETGTTGFPPKTPQPSPGCPPHLIKEMSEYNPARAYCSQFEEIKKECPTCGSMVPETN